MELHILGVDASLTGTAWCETTGATSRTKTAGLTGPQRLLHIRNEVVTVASVHDLVVLEDYSYGSPHQAHQIGELGGVIRLAFHVEHITWVSVAPQARAKFATGKGNAAKDVVMSTVGARTGRAFPNNDECDAYILWAMGQAAYGVTTPLAPSNAQHHEALSHVCWPSIELREMRTEGVVIVDRAPVVEYVPPSKRKKTRS